MIDGAAYVPVLSAIGKACKWLCALHTINALFLHCKGLSTILIPEISVIKPLSVGGIYLAINPTNSFIERIYYNPIYFYKAKRFQTTSEDLKK